MKPELEPEFEAVLVTTNVEREAIFALRMEVFVVEQGVPAAEELDAHDVTAIHLLARETQNPANIIATARLIPYGDSKGVVGRVAVRQAYRGRGIGALLMRFAEDVAKERGMNFLELGAQCYALPFYEKLGYVAEGEIYLDCAIEHRHMSKTLS